MRQSVLYSKFIPSIFSNAGEPNVGYPGLLMWIIQLQTLNLAHQPSQSHYFSWGGGDNKGMYTHNHSVRPQLG